MNISNQNSDFDIFNCNIDWLNHCVEKNAGIDGRFSSAAILYEVGYADRSIDHKALQWKQFILLNALLYIELKSFYWTHYILLDLLHFIERSSFRWTQCMY